MELIGRPRFFKTAAAFAAWLDKHHGQRTELRVGLYKKRSGKASIDWPQRPEQLPAELAPPLRANAKAWAYWQAQTPACRRAAVHWASKPKSDDMKARRLEQLTGDCAAHRRLGALTPPATKR